MNGAMLVDIVYSGTYLETAVIGKLLEQGVVTPSAYLPNDFDIVLAASNVLRRNELNDSTASIEIKEENYNIILENGWISFAVSLFPNARYFTEGEQEAFEGYKRKHFKRFKLNL